VRISFSWNQKGPGWVLVEVVMRTTPLAALCFGPAAIVLRDIIIAGGGRPDVTGRHVAVVFIDPPLVLLAT
jgi:hypothetical protein